MKHIFTLVALLLVALSMHAQSRLVFTYDASGNQMTRTFQGSAAKQFNDIQEEEKAVVAESLKEQKIADQITVYPNPTEGLLKLEWHPSLTKSIQRITASQVSGTSWEIPIKNTSQNFIEVDLTHNADGIYIISFEFIDEDRVTKKIIKNQN